MLPPEALEGAFGEGATMLQILLLLFGLIVEDIDLGKEERAREGGEIGWRVEVAHSSCWLLDLQRIYSSKRPTHTHTHTHTQFTVYMLHVAILEVRRIERRVVQIKRCQWTQHHNCWNQSLQFQTSFSPHVIDLEHTQHYWIHAGECGGLTHTHTHTQTNIPIPCPLPWPWSVLDKFTILFFLKSQSMGVNTLDWPGDRG